MCLRTVDPPHRMDEWLTSQPDPVIAYKSVREVDGKYYPLCQRLDEKFLSTRMNVIKGERRAIDTAYEIFAYRPYFHLFVSQQAAETWSRGESVVFECKVSKKDITAMGTQDYRRVVVTKSFKFVKEVNKKRM